MRVDLPAEAARSFSDVLPDGKWALRTDTVRSISGDYADVMLAPLADGDSTVPVRGRLLVVKRVESNIRNRVDLMLNWTGAVR